MRVLIIEDDADILAFLKKGLEEAGHTVAACGDGGEGLLAATSNTYDVLVVDRMLPTMDGLSVIKNLRGAGNTVPILILSALGQVDDRVKGLRSGGDDYLVKPFDFSELLARIEVIGRRQNTPAQETVLKSGDLELDLLSRKVTRAGKNIDLQAREFRLLEYMLRNKGKIVTRTMLLEHVWDYFFDPQTNVIDVHISRLRSKLNRGFETDIIKTVRGAGYTVDDV